MSEGHLGEPPAQSTPAIQVVEPEPADSPVVPSSDRRDQVEEEVVSEENTTESVATVK